MLLNLTSKCTGEKKVPRVASGKYENAEGNYSFSSCPRANDASLGEVLGMPCIGIDVHALRGEALLNSALVSKCSSAAVSVLSCPIQSNPIQFLPDIYKILQCVCNYNCDTIILFHTSDVKESLQDCRNTDVLVVL